MTRIRIVIADDHTLFRQGVRNLLSAEPDMEVVGEAPNAADVMALLAEAKPDIALLDIGMSGLSSFEAARQIRKDQPGVRVIFLSMYDDEDYVAECVEIGAAGYVLKDSPVEQFLTAIREVSRGGTFLSPRLLSRLVDGFRMNGRGTRPSGGLTKREREILKMLAEGRSVKEIATSFELSVKTVEAHKFNLMRKLDIHNKAQLVQYAIQKKIIRLPEPAFA
jgi:DNA-binding NarL/FixJ family response regulator